MTWKIVFTDQFQNNAQKLANAGLKPKAQKLFEIIREDLFHTPPPYEKLIGDLAGAYSRRINVQHRLVTRFINLNESLKYFAYGRTTNSRFCTGF